MSVIRLSNLKQEQIGVMLFANTLSDSYLSTVGQWVGDCLFLGAVKEAHLLDDIGYLVILDHRELYEHRVTIINDGQTISFNAVSSDNAIIYLSIKLTGFGEWGTIEKDIETKFGYAQILPKRHLTK